MNQRGAAGRVAAVHVQARRTLLLSVAFVIAAPIVAVLPHDTGAWLPLHVFLVGGVLGAISGATQMLAVTWSASPPPPGTVAALQRAALAIGAVWIAVAREAEAADAVVMAGGALVVVALVLLGYVLVQIRRGAVVARFVPAIDAYLVAIVFGCAGTVIGTALATGTLGVNGSSYAAVRAAHLTVNLFGLVGIVIAGTLPYFVATQARVKQSPRATPGAVRAVTGALAVAVVVSVIGALARSDAVQAVGLFAYAAVLCSVALLLPGLGRRQFAWAGPRLVQLGAGLAWWVACVVLLGVERLSGHPSETLVLRALAVGGYAQVVVASLAYFGPVLRGGGHVRLSSGFALTRSWVGVVAANAAAVAALADAPAVFEAALVVWALDVAARTVRLTGGRRAASPAPGKAERP